MKKTLFITLTVLVFIYAIVHIVADRKLNNWIDKNENISVKKTSLNLLLGNVSLDSVEVNHKNYTTDTCNITSIELRNFSIFDYLLKDEINIGEIKIDDATLFLTKPLTKKPENKDSEKKVQKKFHISKITTDDVDLNYKSEKNTIEFRKGKVSLTDFTNTNETKFTDIEVSIKDVFYKPKKGGYNFTTKKIALSNIENIIKVDTFSIAPRCSINQWPKCYPNKKARNSYTVESIIGKLDTTSILNGVFLKELEINNGIYKIFSFQEMKADDSPKDFFMDKFDKLKVPIKIPTIKVKNHKIRVLLKKEKIDTLSFDKVYATFDNVSNIPEVIKKNNSVKVATLSKFMGSDLKVDFDFKIKDPLNSYSFKLALQPMPFKSLNRAVNDNTSLVIEGGILEQLDCEVIGNNQESSGQCAIAYKDLKLTIEGDDGIRKKLVSNVLNLFVKNDTGHTNGKVKPKNHSSTLKRKEDKGFFFHAYTIILKIIRNSILPI